MQLSPGEAGDGAVGDRSKQPPNAEEAHESTSLSTNSRIMSVELPSAPT
jgi:hypothetical protein